MDTHKNPNLQTTDQHGHHHHVPLPSSQDLNTTTTNKKYKNTCFSLAAGGVDTRSITTTRPLPAEESGRERLTKHQVEMSGRVWIPDIWGQEDLLKDWVDCSGFDASLKNKTILSARTALVQEARSTVRIENRC
ncbi:putative protein BIC [Helianthus debilis subsp. tardiflorus]